MKQYLIEFEHDSKFLGNNGYGQLLITARSLEEACEKVTNFSVKKTNNATNYSWGEKFVNARNFVNLTVE